MRHVHPKGLWYMGGIYLLAAFCFGTINSLLVLFLTKNHFSQAQAYSLFAAFNSMVFTLPVVSGYMSEKLGYRHSAIVGLLFCAIGAWVLTLHDHWATVFGLAILSFGLATSATTSYCIVDISYSKDDARRESGFTLFYLTFNVGFLLAATLGGYLARDFGYMWAFRVAAIAVTVAVVAFILCRNKFVAAQGRSLDAQVSWTLPKIYSVLLVVSVIFSGVGVLLLHFEKVNNIVLWLLAFFSGGAIMYLAGKEKTKQAKMKLFVFLFLCVVSVVFWSLYMLEPSLLTLFIKDSVNRHAFGQVIPPSTFYGLDPLFIIVFGAALSWLWRSLAAKNKDLSLPAKFCLSLIFMGVGYILFRVGIYFANAEHLVNMSWIFVGYWFLSMAELLISPIGLSMVGRLSPEGSEGLLMGIWQLFVGLSAIISGYIADTAITPAAGSLVVKNAIYGHSLFTIGAIAVVVGLLVSLLVPQLKRLSA